MALVFQTSLFIPNDSSQNLKIRKKVQMMKFLKMSFTLKIIYLEHKQNVVDVEIIIIIIIGLFQAHGPYDRQPDANKRTNKQTRQDRRKTRELIK